MPLPIASSAPTLLIRRDAYERSGITRAALDERLGLIVEEFRVEGDLVVIGPIPAADDLPSLLAELETLGLSYYDDFFEMSGNWPDWIRVFAAST